MGILAESAPGKRLVALVPEPARRLVRSGLADAKAGLSDLAAAVKELVGI